MAKRFRKIELDNLNQVQEVIISGKFGLYRNLLFDDSLTFHQLAGRLKAYSDSEDIKMPSEEELGFGLLRLVQEGLVEMESCCNNSLVIKFKKLNDNAQLPVFSSSLAAGADLFSTEEVVMVPGQTSKVPTGLSIEMPENFEAQVRSRSGLAAKNGVFVLNSPGTIDSDYRGEICVILHNSGNEKISLPKGSRVAQICFREVPKVSLAWVDELSSTARGSGGFGSTGV